MFEWHWCSLKMKDKKRNRIPSAKDQTGSQVKINNKKGISPFLLLLLPVGITGLCLFPMLQNSFTNWDDEVYVLNNMLLRGPDWKGIFTQPVSSNYHPLTILSLAFNYGISGLTPFSYFFVNILLHLMNTALVFYFIRAISGKKLWVASLSALLFGIHPMHVESVAWISERKDVLYAFFFLWSLIQYWKFITTEKKIHYWASFFLFVLSLLSKPAAIILPLVLLLIDYYKGRPLNRKVIFEKIPYFILSVALALITLSMQANLGLASFEIFPFWMRIFFACYGVMMYFIRFIFPHPLSTFHPYPSPDDLGLAVYISPVFIIGLCVLLWYARKNKILVFGILFFIINLLLVLQVIAIGSTIVSERYTYVPYIGLAFVFAMWIDKLTDRYGDRLKWVVLISVTFVFGIISFERTKVWKDSGALWTDVINQYPVAPSPRSNRAHYLFKKAMATPNASEKNKMYLQIIEDCNAALATANTIILTQEQEKSAGGNAAMKFALYSLRGATFESLGQPDKAKEDYSKCISLFPDQEFAYVNRGAILFEENHFKEALDDFNKAISINPEGHYYLNRSYCQYNLGNREKAKADMQEALKRGESVPIDYQDELK